EFALPASLPPGSYSLEVVANGISSDPVQFSTGALITSQTQGLTVFEGDSASFYVTVSVSSNVLFQWRLGTTPLGGATNGSLTLSNVTLAQAGNYSVIVSNGLAFNI